MVTLVATPIGNLGDLSPRAAQALAEADIICAENTGSFGILMEHIRNEFSYERNPKQRVIPFHKDNEFEKLYTIADLAESRSNIIVLSEAGMPGIADPSARLLRELQKREISYTVIPGASAGSTLLAASGLGDMPNMFIGFLPKKPSDKGRILERCFETSKQWDYGITFTFFESPLRMHETMGLITRLSPQAQVIVGRELTKLHEEYSVGIAGSIAQITGWKGECAFMVRFLPNP